ncbi:AT134-like protein, partial [Mya arenaria]
SGVLHCVPVETISRVLRNIWDCRAAPAAVSLAASLDQYEQWFVAKVQTITKDGTRVTVLKPSASFTLSGASKQIPHHGTVMQCDAALISGNCIVNESMLTGESVPVTKTPLPDSKREHDVKYCLKEHARHTLFCGTQVIQTRYYGNQKIKLGHPVEQIIKRSLDVITIAVPPALPAALTVGIVFAQSRMKKQKIFCISPRSINICGSINAVCFDKTGTLTGDGLNMQGVVPSAGGRFNEEVTDMSQLEKSRIVDAMATCHSLTLIEGHLNGDPLDLIMFHSINWVLEEAGEENSRFDMLVPTIVYPRSAMDNLSSSDDSVDPPSHEIGIVRQLTFTSNLQRMSVIVRRSQGTQFEVYSKGSPEVISSLCKSETETTPVIQQLQDANIKTVMVTGDNMLTALSVAHDCKMVLSSEKVVLVEAELGRTISDIQICVDEDSSTVRFATTGRSWQVLRQFFPDILSKVLVRGVVFARMSPEQKAQLVEGLQELGYYVAMCGDGANDCGALKMAHTGISLSEAEASVASPFTSKDPNITCVPTVIRRPCCTSDKFWHLQVYGLLQPNTVDSNLTDFEFLYIDLALLTTLSVTYGRTEAYPSLVKEPPQLNLFMLNLLVCFAFSSWLAVYPLDWMQDFFEAFLLDHEIFRRKFRQLREKCFPSLKYEYSHIEDEIISTPNWPPVGKDPIIANYRNDTNMAETSAEETEAMLPKIGSKNMCNSSTILSSASGYTPRTSLSDQPYVSMSSVATVSSDFPVSPNNADGDDATDNTFSSSNSFIDEQIKEQTASVDCDTIVSLKGIPEEIKNENQSVD